MMTKYKPGEPLTKDQTDEFNKALAHIMSEQKEAEEREKQRPRLTFMRSAADAGFTETQAKFLWDNRANHKQWDGMVG